MIKLLNTFCPAVFFPCILFHLILVLHVLYISLSTRYQLTITQHFYLFFFYVGGVAFHFCFSFFLQSSEFRYFVSKKWLTKFQSCMEPGNESQMPEGLWWTDLLQACNLLLAMMLTSCLVCFYRAHYKLRLHVPPWR